MARIGAGVSYKPLGASSSSMAFLHLVPYCRRYLIGALLIVVPFVVLFCLFIPDVSTSTADGLTQLQSPVQQRSDDSRVTSPSHDREAPVVKYDGARNGGSNSNVDGDDNDDDDDDAEEATTAGRYNSGGRKINAAREDRTHAGTSEDVHDITSVGDDDRSTQQPRNGNNDTGKGECQLSQGKWVQDTKLSHTHMNSNWCSNMTSLCHLRDTQWQSLRWRPIGEGCDLNDLEVMSFLRTMQNKSILFVGDHVATAMVETLLCVISEVEVPKVVYDNMVGNGSSMWRVEGWSMTLTLVWSPYWVHETGLWGYRRLTMNKLDVRWAKIVPSMDIVVLGSGAWTHSFLKEPAAYVLHDRGLVMGCHGCEDIKAKDGQIEVITTTSTSNTHINNITNEHKTNDSRPTKVKEMSPFTGFRAAIRSCILGIRSLPGFHGTTILLQPPPPTIYHGYNNLTTTSINNINYSNAIYHAISLRMKSIQEEEINKAHLRLAFTNNAPIGVIDTLLPEIDSKNSEISCGVNSDNKYVVLPPYSFTWTQFLHHSLDKLLSSRTNPNEN